MATLAAGSSSRATVPARTSTASPWYHVDLVLVAAALAIAAYGLVMVYSATRVRLGEEGLDPAYFLQRQALFVAIGLGVMVVTAVVDYRVFRDNAWVLYGGTVVVLGLVLVLGSFHKGQVASFDIGPFQLQPSEFGKVTMVVTLAAYVGSVRGEMGARQVVTVLALTGVPLGLIWLQPDLGTSMVFVAALLAVLVASGVKGRVILALLLAGVVASVLVVQLGVLKQYQVDRLTSFLDPQNDTQRSAYNLDQSKTAIGSGGLTGKGLFKGTQTNLSYVPEQHTDFIFTAVGEQLGLAGSALLLALFAVVVWRTWRSAALAKDTAGTLICVGVLAVITFQVFENVGMTMGIMPITGIPLPLMSYGGSATLATFAAIGLVLNVHMRRFS